jgi:hypothetical protein
MPSQATISAGSAASISVSVDGNSAMQPVLVARIISQLDGNRREQSFTSTK